MDMQSLQTYLITTITDPGIKILAAIAFWIVGRWLIGRIIGLIQAGMNLTGPVIAVRPYTNNAHYWQVYVDTNEAIVRTCKEAGRPAPTPTQITRIVQG